MNRTMGWIAGFLVGASLLGCGRGDPERPAPSMEEKVDELTRKVDELRGLLAELKADKPGADAGFREWMNRNLVPGRTTLGEVRAMFGDDSFDLDRPDRDDVLTIEYPLEEVAGKKLVLDFTPSVPRVLRPPAQRHRFPLYAPYLLSQTEWDAWNLEQCQRSWSICGFCPHILVKDGPWRLEGKMLPGAVGSGRESRGVLVLPRARPQDGTVQVRLANWAPEVEHLDQAELGIITAARQEQLDVAPSGEPYLWTEGKPLPVPPPKICEERDTWQFALEPIPESAVLVLELRNTEKFETLTRRAIHDGAALPDAGLSVQFDRGGHTVPAVGTKFLRRVVLPIPAGAREVHLSSPTGLWWLRRAWSGRGRAAREVRWFRPSGGKTAGIPLTRLQARDGQRLRLARNEEADLSFAVPTAADWGQQFFLLRLRGYYEFTPDALGRPDLD